jgi:transcriptional regulator with XRE-family HTH domain
MIITRDDFIKIRKMYRLSQNQMGHILGIKQAAVSRVENKYNRLTEENKEILIKHFNLTPEKLAFIRGTFEMLDSERRAAVV